MATDTTPKKPRIYSMSFASVYPHYVTKAENKGRTKDDVDTIIRWLTGYTPKRLETALAKDVDFETFFANTEPWMAAISGTEYGDPETQKDLLKKLSPIHKLKQVKTPLLVLHGANDTNVPVVEAEQVVETLRKRKVPVDYILFPDEGHGFRKEPNRLRSTVSTVDWFTKYLEP